MNQFRRKVLQSISKDPEREQDWDEYQEAIRGSSEAHKAGGAPDDPRWIHTDEYDAGIDLRCQVYNRLFNEEIGPGGWDNIKAAHCANLAKALDKHTGEGERFLITYGSAHRGRFLRKLRKRKDIELKNPVRFLK